MSNRPPPPRSGASSSAYPPVAGSRTPAALAPPPRGAPFTPPFTPPAPAPGGTTPSAVLQTTGTAILHTGKAGAVEVDEEDEAAGRRRLVVMNAGFEQESDSDEERRRARRAAQAAAQNPHLNPHRQPQHAAAPPPQPPLPTSQLDDFAPPAMDRRPTFVPSRKLGAPLEDGAPGGDGPTDSISAPPAATQQAAPPRAAQTANDRRERGGGAGADRVPGHDRGARGQLAPSPGPAAKPLPASPPVNAGSSSASPPQHPPAHAAAPAHGAAPAAATPSAPGAAAKPPQPFGLLQRTPDYEAVARIKRAINAANRLPPERERDKDERLDRAFVDLTRLCGEGSAEAQYYLAREFGKDDKWEEALKYFIVASRAGHVPSAYQAGLCFEHRRGFEAHNPAYVARMYHQAACAGYLPALYRAADPQARQGVAGACWQMAKGLEKEDEEQVDGDYLVALLEVAGEGGYAKARFRLGQIFEQGLYGVVQDPHRAYRYFRKAADHMDGEAMFRLASVFERGELTADADPARAFRYYARASERGIVAAVNRMGEIFEGGLMGQQQNSNQALRCYRDGAHRGSADAMHNLARIHLEGLYGQTRGTDAAMEAFLKGAKRGKPEALHALGQIYEKGMYGQPASADEALRCYEQALAAGSAKAAVRLGKAYEFGELARAADADRAVAMYRTASEQGDPLGHFLLAGWYYTGNSWLVRKSPEEAFRLLRKAVAGDPVPDGAEYRLGSFYEHGTGTQPDLDTAVYHYRNAAQRGDASAMRKLNQLGMGSTTITNGRR